MKLIWGSVITISLLFLMGCGPKKTSDEAVGEKAVPVSVESVEARDVKNIVSVTGKVNPKSEVDVFTKTPGKVEAVLVDVGTKVVKGQVLLELEKEDVALTVRQAEAGLNIAKANYDRTVGGAFALQISQLESNARVAELSYRDAKSAFQETERKYQTSAVPKEVYEVAQTRYQSAKEQYENAQRAFELNKNQIYQENVATAKAQVEQAQTAYDVARNTLNNLTITSPVDGVIASKQADLGALLSPGVPIFKVVDMQQFVVDVSVLEDVITKLRVGDFVDVFISSIQAEPFQAKIETISPAVDERTNAYGVRLTILEPNEKLRGGMIANIQFIAEKKEAVLTVSIDAILTEGEQKWVYRIVDGVAKKTMVTTGIFDDQVIEITKGLKADDNVVVEGQTLLDEDIPVEIIK